MQRVAGGKLCTGLRVVDVDGQLEHVHGHVPHPLVDVGDDRIHVAWRIAFTGRDLNSLAVQLVDDQFVGLRVGGDLLDVHGLQHGKVGAGTDAGGGAVGTAGGDGQDGEDRGQLEEPVHDSFSPCKYCCVMKLF